MRAPGRRYDDPSTRTTVASAQRSPRRARQNAVSFGKVADAYRAHLRKEGKDWKREESRIANIEAFISRERDTAAVDIVWYRRVLDEVELLAPETRRHYASTLLAMLNYARAERVIPIDPVSRSGWFKLADHKNKRKGITARGALHPKFLVCLLDIRPANASGLVHPNPATGFAYVDIRKQWDHLIEIASRLLGYRLEGKKADFFNLRHSGASHIAASQRDARHLLGVVWMMGDTSIATVNRHYFNLDKDTLREIIQAWAIPEVVDLYGSFRLPLAS